MQSLVQDLRFGARMLVKQPGFTVIAMLTLALGIGANTAIFSVVNAALLRSLPFPEPEQLIRVYASNAVTGGDLSPFSYQNFLDWKARNQSFAQASAYTLSAANLTGGDAPARIRFATVTTEFFDVLGIDPLAGRTLAAEDGRPGRGEAVVLSYGFWRRHFGGDPAVIGKTVRLNQEQCTVIGVMPARMNFPAPDVELWKPLAVDPDVTGSRDSHWLSAIVRLKSGVTLAQATADLKAVAAGLAEEYPDDNKGWGVELIPLHAAQSGESRTMVLLLWAAVGLVLLIACANVANLLLARSSAREKELAIRSALGASRGRIMRQLLTESVLLSLIGGAVGLLLAVWGVTYLQTLISETVPQEVSVERSVMAYALALSLLVGVLFGLVPASRAGRIDLNASLKEGGRGSAVGARHRVSQALVIGEIALTLVLLVGVGLLLRSFRAVLNVDPGFDPQRVLTARIAPPQLRPQPGESISSIIGRYKGEREQMAVFYREFTERLNALPGVDASGAINALPISGQMWMQSFAIEGQPLPTPADAPVALGRVVLPGYFHTLTIPLLQGRDLAETDTHRTMLVAVISQSLAERHWPDGTPIGKRVRFGVGMDDPFFDWVTIVGVVGDVRQDSLEAEPAPMIYVPLAQATFGFFGDWGMTLVARTKSETSAVINEVRQLARDLDPTLPLFEISTLDQLMRDSLEERRSLLLLLECFGGLALVLAAIGLYGLVSFLVSQRSHEIGIRLALGAQLGDVLRMAIGQGLKLALIGIGIGLVAALALTRLMSSLLFGVGATDPLTFGVIALLLISIALLACLVPARRAMRVDPLIALRCE